jgi:acyl-coenzyme A thioesterase PaaI-like protein
VAAGVVVQAGRRIGRAEGALRSEDGTVLARAVGTFAALDTPAP